MKKYIIWLMWYLWVWFISWAMSHWFLSWTRNLIMAWIGITIFLLSEFLKEWEKNYVNTIAFWLFYGLCVGMVSWWFQHFLDDPERSTYIIPIWFVLGYIIYTYKENKNNLNLSNIIKVLAAWFLLFALSYSGWKYLPNSAFSPLANHHEKEEATDIHENNIEKRYSDLWYSWMKWQTNEKIKEHCQMMPSMEWCSEISKTDTSESENPTNINNTGAMQHEMNHADMVNSVFDFVYLMIPHHQEAVDTSKILLQTTKNPELIKLANNIISGQDKEISMMKWRINTMHSGDKYEWMWYMLMMRPTSGLNTDQIDLQRAEDMIKHHQWAIDMSNKLLQIIENIWIHGKMTAEFGNYMIELREFGKAIIVAQTKEIQDMKNIISGINNHNDNMNHH